jgi:hypothetical protein
MISTLLCWLHRTQSKQLEVDLYVWPPPHQTEINGALNSFTAMAHARDIIDSIHLTFSVHLYASLLHVSKLMPSK